jgi:hypothetical protein
MGADAIKRELLVAALLDQRRGEEIVLTEAL